jgi:hypothetical protein
MLAPAFATGAVEPDPLLPPEPDPSTDPNLEALSRVRQAARSIAERVRHALSPPGFVPMRVLVVDDHPDAADALAAVLELLGCPVRACHNGQEALAVVGEFQPQVCLIDLVMPGMDGLELAARLRVWAAGRPRRVGGTPARGDQGEDSAGGLPRAPREARRCPDPDRHPHPVGEGHRAARPRHNAGSDDSLNHCRAQEGEPARLRRTIGTTRSRTCSQPMHASATFPHSKGEPT